MIQDSGISSPIKQYVSCAANHEICGDKNAQNFQIKDTVMNQQVHIGIFQNDCIAQWPI
jgi:hypothetical protein